MPREITRCPSCGGGLRPVALMCEPCGLRIEGMFHTNEFATLAPDDLHLLRILVHTEGHIKEMESALGVSYPTVKSRLADLKAKLSVTGDPNRKANTGPNPESVEAILRGLEDGTIEPDDAIRRLRLARSEAQALK